jgi:hypothetical protein
MNFRPFGGIRIFRPQDESEIALRIKAEQNLRSKYSVGVYTNKDTINEILRHQFAFYSKILAETIPSIASLHFVDFLLFQYGEASKVEFTLYRGGKLNARDRADWETIGPTFRRAVKYLIELAVQHAPQEQPGASEDSLLSVLDRVWICAEELIELYILSDQTFLIFPDDTTLTIYPKGGQTYWSLELDKYKLCSALFHQRVRDDSINRERFLPAQFDADIDEHEAVLASAFKDTVGLTYREALQVVQTLMVTTIPSGEGFPIPFMHREIAIVQLSKFFGFSEEAIGRALDGFSLSKENMETEGREVWKPKQEYRAFRRGFFVLPHPMGRHLVWSKEMAGECLIHLEAGVAFRHLPPEWRSSAIDRALEALSLKAGKWFENVVMENLAKVGIVGEKSLKDGIGRGGKRITIPSKVGEIDFLGYSPGEQLLVIVECKLVQSALEARYFRDEINEFVNSRRAYAKKFRKKIDWVLANTPSIGEALASIKDYDTQIAPQRVAIAMITLYPTIASCFIEDFPCVSLTEMMMEYEKVGKWPYEVGLHGR